MKQVSFPLKMLAGMARLLLLLLLIGCPMTDVVRGACYRAAHD